MFCPKCGQKLIPQTRFCAHCGADIQSLLQQVEEVPSTSQENTPKVHEPQKELPTPDVPMQVIREAKMPGTASEAQDPIPEGAGSPRSTDDSNPFDIPMRVIREARMPGTEPTGNSAPLTTVVGKNQVYYLPEFQRIRTGKKSRFNWAAFLFGPAFCLYRKCQDLFKRYFLIPIPLMLIGYLVQTIGTVQFNLTLITGGGIMTGVGGILGFINLIRLGLQFNQLYYERCSGPVSPDRFGTSMQAAAAFYAAIILSVALIGGAGAIAIRHQYSAIFESDTPGMFDMSDIQGSSFDTSGSSFQPIGIPSNDANQFDDFVGVWQSEYDSGDYLFINYEDETAQQAYAEVIVDGIYFVAELTRISNESIYGTSVDDEYGAIYEIDLIQIESGLEAVIYYAGKVVDYVSFVPGGYGDEIDDPGGISYDDYNLYFYEGYYTEASESVEVTLSVVPNGSSFACELFWNYGKLLELGTVRPGVPTLLSEGTTITIDLEPSGNIYVLLEDEDLWEDSYSFYMMKH